MGCFGWGQKVMLQKFMWLQSHVPIADHGHWAMYGLLWRTDASFQAQGDRKFSNKGQWCRSMPEFIVAQSATWRCEESFCLFLFKLHRRLRFISRRFMSLFIQYFVSKLQTFRGNLQTCDPANRQRFQIQPTTATSDLNQLTAF